MFPIVSEKNPGEGNPCTSREIVFVLDKGLSSASHADPKIISPCSKSFDEKRWLTHLARTTVVIPPRMRENENCTPPIIENETDSPVHNSMIGPLPFDELSEGFIWAKSEGSLFVYINTMQSHIEFWGTS